MMNMKKKTDEICRHFPKAVTLNFKGNAIKDVASIQRHHSSRLHNGTVTAKASSECEVLYA
jgi:hypothetical protein